jgi:hypothetical protein
LRRKSARLRPLTRRDEARLARKRQPQATRKKRTGPRPIYPSDLEYARPTYTVFQNARARAREAGEVFTLTEADIHIPDLCPALRISLYVTRERGGGDHSPSLEIIHPERGWVPGNVIVVSALAKRIMSDSTADELLRIASFWEAEQAKPFIPSLPAFGSTLTPRHA